MLRIPFFLVLSFSLMTDAFCQKEAKYYENGLTALSSSNYPEALRSFRQAYNLNPEFNDVQYKIEFLSLLTPEGDEKSLDKMISYESEFGSSDDHYFYWLGQVYLRRYQIEDAIKSFERFHQKIEYTGNVDSESQALIAHSKELQYFFNNPGNYEIHQLDAPVNSAGSELSPVFFEGGNELLFASDRSGSGEAPFSIYYTKQTPTGWSALKEVTNLGNFTKSNANIEVVNGDGKLFLFKEDKGGDLFYSQSSGETWTIPVEFDARISNNYLASHFFINEHEDRIVFASDVSGNGLDIYESFRDPENNKWSKPAPFYSIVNSNFNEDSPYLSPEENAIYFSSDRPGGIGGYDVYVSYLNAADYSWSEPENLGWPINSPNNEVHYKLNTNQKSGYFVSDRIHTKGNTDIYAFWEVQKIKIEGRIFDETAGKALSDAEIRFRPSQYLDESFSSPIDYTGRYKTDIISDETFKVEIIKNGKIIFTESFEIHDTSGEPTTYHKDFSVK